MIRTLAIDDEPLALQQLAAYIKKIPYLELVGECQSAIDAHTLMQKESVDAIFCDISMPDLNGLDFVRALNPRPLVVFTTAYSQYAVEGYKVDADDYLLKPFSFEEFQQAAERVHRQYDLLHQEEAAAASASEIDENDDIFLKTEYKVMRVAVSDIRCVEGMSEYLKIHLVSRDRPVVVLMSMKKSRSGCRTPPSCASTARGWSTSGASARSARAALPSTTTRKCPSATSTARRSKSISKASLSASNRPPDCQRHESKRPLASFHAAMLPDWGKNRTFAVK